jgi:hypothetical protein
MPMMIVRCFFYMFALIRKYYEFHIIWENDETSHDDNGLNGIAINFFITSIFFREKKGSVFMIFNVMRPHDEK